jgi:hypothetical protein
MKGNMSAAVENAGWLEVPAAVFVLAICGTDVVTMRRRDEECD